MAVACALAFKRGSYEGAVRLMRHLEHPEHAAIVFSFRLTNNMTWSEPATVSLLHLAAYHGWLDIVMNCKLKVLYECKDSVGRTLLQYAAVGGSLPVVQYLITVGHCNPATLGPHNSTLLHYACVGGHMNIINYLITELQCDPTVHSNDDGCLPLHTACQYGHLKLTKFLINEENCDPTSQDKNGLTPLFYAIIWGHMNIIDYLITELHCDPTICSNDSCLPLHIACLYGNLNVTKFFITEQNCDPTSYDEEGWTALHYASRGGHMNIIEYLITELYCDPTVCSNDGCLPLHIACLDGKLNVAKFFITEQNCDPTSHDKEGWTPLHYASQGGHMNIIQYLITELKCDPTVHSNDGCLPLHVACQYGKLKLTKFFITEQNCDPTIHDEEGWTPLHYASQGGHMNIIEYLITELQCDPTVHSSGDSCLPIHVVCKYGHLKLTKFFITEQNCDPTSQDKKGWTPLHYASRGGHMNIIEYLITELHCDPTVCSNDGCLPLHIACLIGNLNVTKFFITEQNCDPTSHDELGRTPLHYASQGGHMNIIEYLITELHCHPIVPTNNNGCLPLHIACLYGHLNVTKFFIAEQNCDPVSQDEEGWTPLHYASQGGHMNIIRYLITELKCYPTVFNDGGCLPLHIACLNGHLNVTKFFITEQNCDPTIYDEEGWTPLHYASQGGHMNIVEYLTTELHCDPTVRSSDGSLPLHVSCHHGHLNITKYFIAEQNCDLKSLNIHMKTPLHYACENDHKQIIQYFLANYRDFYHFDWVTRTLFYMVKRKNFEPQQTVSRLFYARRFSVKELFHSLAGVKKEFPIHSYNKVILTGNSAAGKTTLTAVITERAATHFIRFKYGNVQQVELNTAGICPSYVKSREVGNLVLYDLAGHAQYHSTHYAVIETVMKQSPATFIIVVDLSKPDTDIAEQLSYWVNFIDNATCRMTDKSCLIIVGSHADLLARKVVREKKKIVNDFVQKHVKRQEFIGVVSMDCRKIDCGDTRKFVSHLSKSQHLVSSKAPLISFNCHFLYALLHLAGKYADIALKLQTFATFLDQEHSSGILPSDIQLLNDLLVSLSCKGVIIYLQNDKQLAESWIVVDTETLLNEINGKLFDSGGLKVVASDAGIVHSLSLQKLLPDYDLEMLVGFLELLELCHHVNISGTSANLMTKETHTSGDITEAYLFFPSLLSACRPRTIENTTSEEEFSFGWCLSLKNTEQNFFTIRFLHVLLLRLAYTFPLASAQHVQHAKCCSVWENGILWDNAEGIRTVVELIDNNQCVVVAMSYRAETRQLEYLKHRSSVIKLVLDLQQELDPHLKKSEFFIDLPLLKRWSSDDWCVSTGNLLPVENVCSSMLLHKPYILTSTGAYSDFSTKQVLEFEPYYRLRPSSVCELMNRKIKTDADKAASAVLLHEMRTCFKQSLQLKTHNYWSMRECLDKMSLFAGRNPIVSNVCK